MGKKHVMLGKAVILATMMDSYYHKAKRSNRRHLQEIHEYHYGRWSPEKSAAPEVASDDYIRRWLSQTQRRPDRGSYGQNQHDHGRKDSMPSWRPHSMEAAKLDHIEHQVGVRKRRGYSPDSSIIPFNPKRVQEANCSSEHVARIHYGANQNYFELEAPKFERRSRHKTRPDRYDTNKEKHPQREKEAGAFVEKPGRAKEGSSKTKKISSRRDIMKSYTSDAVQTNDRLTVRLSTC